MGVGEELDTEHPLDCLRVRTHDDPFRGIKRQCTLSQLHVQVHVHTGRRGRGNRGTATGAVREEERRSGAESDTVAEAVHFIVREAHQSERLQPLLDGLHRLWRP